MPIAVGLRTSLEYYLRRNHERLDEMALEAARATQQRDGMLRLLPPEERKLRKQIFKLEDETTRLSVVNATQAQESAQVGKLLHETIRRNAELIDAVATLQNQVDLLRRGAAGEKVKKASKARARAASKAKKLAPAPASVASDPARAAREFRAADHNGLPRPPASEDTLGSLWEAGLSGEESASGSGLDDIPVGFGGVMLS